MGLPAWPFLPFLPIEDDKLSGHGGRDLLIGGLGADKLKGQQDDDILIGGKTPVDNDLSSLSAIMEDSEALWLLNNCGEQVPPKVDVKIGNSWADCK